MMFGGMFDEPRRARPKFTQKEKELHYKAQNGKCNLCGKKFEMRNLAVDHIKAFSKGGTDRGHNLQLLCTACNSSKGAGTQGQAKNRLEQQGVIKGKATSSSKAGTTKKAPKATKKTAKKQPPTRDPLADLFRF